MKRIVALLLCLLMIISLAACEGAGKKTTYQKYQEAYDKTNALSDQDCQLKLNMDLALDGMTLSVPMTTVMQVKRDGDAIKELAMEITMTLMGTEQNYKSYYADGYMYYQVSGNKYKQAMSPEELTGQEINTDSLLLTEEMMASAAERTENGATIVDVTVPGDQVKDQLMTFFGGDLNELLGVSADSVRDMKFSDVTASFTIGQNGYFTATSMAFQLTMSVAMDATTDTYSDVSCDVDIALEYRNPGEAVTIVPFEDLDSYVEASASGSGESEFSEEEIAAISALLDLYDSESPIKLENYDEGFQALVEQYGAETMTFAENYVNALVEQFNASAAG